LKPGMPLYTAISPSLLHDLRAFGGERLGERF